MKKNLLSYFLIILISLLAFSCKDDEPVIQKGKVEFGFNLKDISQGKIKSLKADAEPAAIVVSIEDAAGTLVYDTEEVELYNMNGYFISKPLSLLVGSYTVEKFLVVDAEGNVIYASPLEGSELAYLVNGPLPIDFSVSKDEVTKLVPEVLSTESLTPEDFGYVTFSFDVVETFDFLLSVFVYNETEQNFELTDAYLTVTAEGNAIYSDTLAAITNQVKVNDGFDPYILTVEKENYNTYVDTFTNTELKLYFSSEDKGPLVVILENDTIVTGQPCPGTPTVTDADGNVYPTVQIGDQCWMAENIRVGTMINAPTDQSNNGITEKYCYENDPTNCDTYGGLYQWNEMMAYNDTIPNLQGICPDGWHIPNTDEVIELNGNYDASFQPQYAGWFIFGGFSFLDMEADLWTNAMTANTQQGLSGQGVTENVNFFRPHNNAQAQNYGLSVRCIKN